MERGVGAQQRCAGRLAEEDQLIQADVHRGSRRGAGRQLELVVEEAAADFRRKTAVDRDLSAWKTGAGIRSPKV